MSDPGASLDLCRQLYEVSDWKPEGCEQFLVHVPTNTGSLWDGHAYHSKDAKLIPVYDTDYLLRKLPAYHGKNMLTLKWNQGSLNWMAGYQDIDGYFEDAIFVDAPNPAQALVELCIVLFNQGILTKETN